MCERFQLSTFGASWSFDYSRFFKRGLLVDELSSREKPTDEILGIYGSNAKANKETTCNESTLSLQVAANEH
jgi:hypothetical protein